MSHNCDLFMGLAVLWVTKFADKVIRVAVGADFFQVHQVKIYCVVLEVAAELVFAAWICDLIVFNYIDEFLIKGIPQAGMHHYKAFDP